jgi:ATP-dependent RNA helicase RhlE
MERELKVTFQWSEADKDLEKEERNKPLDLTAPVTDLLALETRAWRSGDASAQPQSRSAGPHNGNGRTGFRSRPGSGGRSSTGRSSGSPSRSSRPGSNHPGAVRSGPARRGQ